MPGEGLGAVRPGDGGRGVRPGAAQFEPGERRRGPAGSGERLVPVGAEPARSGAPSRGVGSGAGWPCLRVEEVPETPSPRPQPRRAQVDVRVVQLLGVELVRTLGQVVSSNAHSCARTRSRHTRERARKRVVTGQTPGRTAAEVGASSASKMRQAPSMWYSTRMYSTAVRAVVSQATKQAQFVVVARLSHAPHGEMRVWVLLHQPRSVSPPPAWLARRCRARPSAAWVLSRPEGRLGGIPSFDRQLRACSEQHTRHTMPHKLVSEQSPRRRRPGLQSHGLLIRVLGRHRSWRSPGGAVVRAQPHSQHGEAQG